MSKLGDGSNNPFSDSLGKVSEKMMNIKSRLDALENDCAYSAADRADGSRSPYDEVKCPGVGKPGEKSSGNGMMSCPVCGGMSTGKPGDKVPSHQSAPADRKGYRADAIVGKAPKWAQSKSSAFMKKDGDMWTVYDGKGGEEGSYKDKDYATRVLEKLKENEGD